jgi:hypothetical protein
VVAVVGSQAVAGELPQQRVVASQAVAVRHSKQRQALRRPWQVRQWLVVDLLIHKIKHDWQLLGAVGSPIPKTLRA